MASGNTAKRTTKTRTPTSKESQIINWLPTLPRESLDRVKQHVDALLQTKVEAEPDDTSDLQLIYDCMERAIRLGGVAVPPPKLHEFRARHKGHMKLLEDNAQSLERYVREEFKARTRIERQKVYSLCFKLLKDRLRANDESVGVISMLKSMHQIPDAVDNAFPGYSDAKMLPFILG